MNGKMILGIILLVAGIAGIYLVLTGKLPPSSTTGGINPGANNSNLGANAAGTLPGEFAGGNATNLGGVTGNGTTIVGTTSGGTSASTATQGQKPAGSGGQSFASAVNVSRPFLAPIASSSDRYLTGGAFR